MGFCDEGEVGSAGEFATSADDAVVFGIHPSGAPPWMQARTRLAAKRRRSFGTREAVFV